MTKQKQYKGPAYPTEAHGSIPAFGSYEEEAEFWDTHDFTEFEQETRPIVVRSTRGLSANVQVRFDPDTDHELEAIARERGMKKATLIRTWVLEHLRQMHNQSAPQMRKRRPTRSSHPS
jgi:hypothetical protein